MIFVELFASPGTLTREQRGRLSRDLMTGVMPAQDGAPPEAVASARAYTQVVIHEPETWIAGGDTIGPPERPRYLVRVTVPVTWRKDMSPTVIREVTRVLAEYEPDPTRLYTEPAAWIQVMGVPDGSCGLFGQPQSGTDIVQCITQPYRDGAGNGRTTDLPPGTALDPVCGMTVSLTDAFTVVEVDDTTYAFCAPSCHRIFERGRGVAAE